MSQISWDLIDSNLLAKKDLSDPEVTWAMSQILQGVATNEQIKDFLIGLKNKGETAAEVNALVNQMYAFASDISIADRCVDSVGTGGDGASTINISTMAAIVTTAAGGRVVKHGNRAATSKSGSADLLEAFGIKIDLNGAQVANCVHKIGIGFCFAPVFHPAMKNAAAARKELGVPTVFNILGPLANPAKPKAVAIGVANPKFLNVMAKVLADRGNEGFVFRGDDGLDELSISTTSTVIQINDGKMKSETLDPSELGIMPSPISELKGGDAKENARLALEVFSGKQGAMRDATLLNAAAAIAAFKADFHLGILQQFANAMVLAKQAIDSGAATLLVESWRNVSNSA
jgi:anthranilate phosphoribosyltransferase